MREFIEAIQAELNTPTGTFIDIRLTHAEAASLVNEMCDVLTGPPTAALAEHVWPASQWPTTMMEGA